MGEGKEPMSIGRGKERNGWVEKEDRKETDG